jgi:hypothetical protein
MEYDAEKKISDNEIKIIIFHNKSNYKEAKLLKNKIETKYKNGIKDYALSVKIQSYKNSYFKDANIYYLLPTSSAEFEKIILDANKTNTLTFSYLQDDLGKGAMVSLNISNKIKPILNLDAVKTANISLKPSLINISMIFKKEV